MGNTPTGNIVNAAISNLAETDFSPQVKTQYLPDNLPVRKRKIVYTLTLQGDDGPKYYVGTTYDLPRRIEEHQTGRGSAWTRMYIVLDHTWKYQKSTQDEDAEVKRLMGKHGINNVRGGSYSQPVLESWQIKALKAELNTTEDRCFRCHRKGHYTNMCYAKTTADGSFIV